jgi:2-dehydro-3-deoxygluconokinase
MTHLLTLGEALAVFHVADGLPLAEATTFRRTVAGAELNVANGFVRLGHTAGFVSAVGQDSLGTAVFERVRACGLEAHVSRVEAPTGVLVRELAGSGEVDTLHLRSASAASQLTAKMVHEAWTSNVDVVYVTGITMVLSPSASDAVLALVSLARAHGATVVLDPNLRERLASADRFAEELAKLKGMVDILIGDRREIELFAGTATEPVSTCLDLGCQVVVTKRGPEGARATDGRDAATAPARPTRIVDTIGAGDAFTAGFVSRYLETADLDASLRLGVDVAARVVATPGDLEGFPRTSPAAPPGGDR